MKSPLFSALAGAMLLFAAASSATAGPVWSSSSCVSSSSYRSATCTSTGAVKHSATVTGWSASSTGNFTAGYVAPFDGGLGVVASIEVNNYNSPQHATDNNGGTDAVLLSFGSSLALNQLRTGWFYGDADVSILRYTGTTAPTLTSSRISTLVSTGGWELVGNYSFLNVSTPLSFNAASKTSSWWLVSAYNSGYAGHTAGLDNSDDYFKLSSFSGEFVTTTPETGKVPEPGTWSLMGIAMLGLALGRRKLRA